jgi:hypothetical protein
MEEPGVLQLGQQRELRRQWIEAVLSILCLGSADLPSLFKE